MSNFWLNKRVLVTGGAGFIGSHVCENLVAKGAKVSILDKLKPGKEQNIAAIKDSVRLIKGDIQDFSVAKKACHQQDVVMNLAAKVGGIEYNRTHQGTMLFNNLMIASSMTEAAKQEKVERFLAVSSACVYPRDAMIPTPETEGFRDEPEPTNGGYGWGKRVAELLARYYSEEFGMKMGIVRPYNCYGPRDHFDPETSHVIPALIKRVFDGENPIKVWGSGKQSRAFLYVEDMAEGMVQIIEKYPEADAVNLGTDEEITIAELIKKIIKFAGKDTKIEFDTTKPDGSPRRNSNNTKLKKHVGFSPTYSLDDGLKRTIEWYRNEYLK